MEIIFVPPNINTETIIIKTVAASIDQDDAYNIVKRHSDGFIVALQKKIFYPYFWVYFSYSVKTVFGRVKENNASCFVDLINNQASTTDRFAVEETEAIKDNVLEYDYGPESALETAKTYFTHSFIHNTRLLTTPEYEILEQMLVYKPFWIVKCSNHDKYSYKVIVDAATGKFQLL